MEIDQDKNIICRATRRNFRYILLWPKFKEELNPGINYYLKVATYFLSTFLLPLGILTHVVITLTQHLNLPFSEDIATIASMVGIHYMTFIYVKHQPQLARLFRDLSNFDRFDKPPDFEKKEKVLNMLSNASFWYTVLALTFYASVKLFSTRAECEKRNRERGLDENCGFVVSIWTPFSTNHNFIVYCFCGMITFVLCQLLMKTNVMVTVNAFEITQHVILRIEVLTKLLRQCFDVQDYEVSRRKLTKCITYHIDIIQLAKRLDECFSASMLTHITITAIICACLEKQFADGDYFLAGMHVSGWLVTLVLACISGQALVDATESISEAIWFSKWYEADIRLRKDVLFMLLRSQEILYLTAGPFSVLSFSLLVSVLKMSYSIFCFLTS